MKVRKISVVLLILPFLLIPSFAGAALINGGFEDGLANWDPHGTVMATTELVLEGIPFEPYELDQMAAITLPGMTGHVMDNYILQEVTLESGDNYFNFVYIFWTLDEAPFDNPGFLMEINGKTILSMQAGDIGDGVVGTLDYTVGGLDGGWTGISVPIAQYYDPVRPATIRISFSAGNTGDNQYPSGVFIDGPRQEDGLPLSPDPLPEYRVIPIPASLLLLGSGLIALIGIRRRRS